MPDTSHSRRRPRSKGGISPPTERVAKDSVTGELVTTSLDAVFLAFEAVCRVYQNSANAHELTDADRERLADMVLVWVLRTKRHRDADVEALRGLLAVMGRAT